MRIRQIKPEWWSDKALMREHTADSREFYIGLWQQADDDGYLRWEPDRIAAELYMYRTMAARERQVRTMAAQLVKTGHLVLLACGLHATVPKMPRHQVIASTRRVTRVHAEHSVQCERTVTTVLAHEGTERKGTERNGTERDFESNVEAAQRILHDESSSEPAKRAARKALQRLGIESGDPA